MLSSELTTCLGQEVKIRCSPIVLVLFQVLVRKGNTTSHKQLKISEQQVKSILVYPSMFTSNDLSGRKITLPKV